jgi:hypothetical protein
MKNRAIGVGLLALALLVPASAWAGTITYAHVGTPKLVPVVDPTLTDLTNMAWAFPEYDPNLFGGADLLSVRIQYTATVNSDFTITNTNGSSSITDGGISREVVLVLTGDDGLAGVNAALETSQFVFADTTFASPNTGPMGFPSGTPGAIAPLSSRSGSGTVTGSSTNPTFTNFLILQNFTGSGTEDLFVSTFSTTDLTYTGGNASVVQQTFVNLTGQITYEFEDFPSEVPEPSSMLLLGSGLTLIGYGIRRRKKS